MNYFLLIFFGVLPCIFWLIFYLKKDNHPEPRGMVLQVFLFGAIIAIPVALLECIPLGVEKNGELICFFSTFFSENFSPLLGTLLYYVLIVALIEEVFKYLVVRFRVLKNENFDEPLDAMLYMIIAALGFAAVENILIMFQVVNLQEAIYISLARLVGAVFLHTLSSGIIGYFLALSFYRMKNHFAYLATGFFIAITLHGLYNFSIIKVEGIFKFLVPFLLLLVAAIFVTLGFKKLKKLKSICLPK